MQLLALFWRVVGSHYYFFFLKTLCLGDTWFGLVKVGYGLLFGVQGGLLFARSWQEMCGVRRASLLYVI